ncbi:AsmA-like C-terminal region-containing protein [uncultured Thiohalocapsa sp.]|uniref:AsmA family protein n=1 Tax=uncultured Thiohalocapsa sp. TaxID=768990 RepID=UPI0025FFE873|nr:AsmA-like C-terminal region-containing protein [uncultured Thiohalocapsa sp.]
MSTAPPRRKALRSPAAWALALAGLLVLALVGLLAAAPLLVDREGLRARIQAEATLALGLPVRIDTVSDLHLLPRPRIVLGPVRVLGPPPAPPPVAASASDQAAPVLATAERMRLELALPALLMGRAEPVLLQATGIDFSLAALDAAALPPRPAGVALPDLGAEDARVTLSYPPDARRLAWPLFAAPGVPPQAAQTGPLDIAAEMPLAGTQARSGATLALVATAETSALPVLTLAPVRITGKGLHLGTLRDLAPVLSIERAVRDADGAWRLEGIALMEGGLVISADASAALTPQGLTADGSLGLAPLDLRSWLAGHADQPLPGRADRWRCVAAAGDFRLMPDRLDIAAFALRLDDSRARAAASLYFRPTPRTALALRLDSLDLDPYLAAPAPSAPAAGTASCAPVTTAAADGPAQPQIPQPQLPQPQLPIQPPPDTAPDLSLDLVTEQLRAAGLAFADLGITAQRQGDHGIVDVAAGAFYGGSLDARLERMQYAGAPPRQTLRARISGADLGALLADLQGEPQMTGTVDLTAELAATGSDAAALRSDLSGTLRLAVVDGRVAALDRAATDFGPLLGTVGLDVTPDLLAVSRLSLSAQAQGGVFASRDIQGQAQLFSLAGVGELDVANGSLAADLAATLEQPPDGPDLKGLAGIQVPIRVAGPLAAPKVDAQLGPAVAEAARRAARRHLDKDGNVLEQLEEATGVQGLEQGLRSLFGL